MLEFCTKSPGSHVLAHGTEIPAPGSVTQQLQIYPFLPGALTCPGVLISSEATEIERL